MEAFFTGVKLPKEDGTHIDIWRKLNVLGRTFQTNMLTDGAVFF